MIVAKLEWPRAGNSTRQVQDVASIVRIRASEIDMDRVEHWIAALGLQTEGAAARSLAGLSG